MFEKKKILFLLATSALLVACSGGDDTQSSSAGTLTTGTGVPPTGTGTPPTNSGTPPPVAKPPAPVDQQLKGFLEVVANQILYIRRNRVIYLPVPLTQFESDKGIVDIAAGSPTPPPLAIDAAGAGCTLANDGTCGVQPPAAAPAAPIAAFGIRIGKFVQPMSSGQSVANQTVVGRIAFDLSERKDSPGLGANEVAESMKFVIDMVEISTSQNGEIVSVKLQEGAQIHVDGRNAAGVEVRADIPAPANTVRLLPLSQVPDGHGDPTSIILLLDLESGFSQAGNKLAALENIAGQFSMHITFSSMQELVRVATDATDVAPAVERKDLVGEQITVHDQPPVSGAGINGTAWIRMYPAL